VKEVRVPGDKSLTHRALLLAALASGRSRIRLPLVSADTESTAAVLRVLGCAVPHLEDRDEVIVDGRGLRGLRAHPLPLDCGNSGTTARLLMGVLAAHEFTTTLTGDESLRSRPMRRVTRPLAAMGASFEELERADRLPIRMHGGGLRDTECDSAQASAQVKSAVLLAGLCGGARVTVREPHLSRDHTERMLARLGVPLDVTTDARGVTVRLTPVAALPPLDFSVPGDFSSAAFVLALGCLGSGEPVRVRDVGLNPARTGFLRVLERMGADVCVEDVRDETGEPVGSVTAAPSQLRGTDMGAAEIPALIDEIPVIAVLAACAQGTTVISGAAELRVKETDRIAALVRNLRELDVDVEEHTDGMTIHGSGRPLSGRVSTFGDHRIAMAFGILDAVGGNRVEIDDPDVVNVSYPAFWNMLAHVAAS
jgi:3-phosphoshikimate 1-carboxyvinyltransferase